MGCAAPFKIKSEVLGEDYTEAIFHVQLEREIMSEAILEACTCTRKSYLFSRNFPLTAGNLSLYYEPRSHAVIPLSPVEFSSRAPAMPNVDQIPDTGMSYAHV